LVTIFVFFVEVGEFFENMNTFLSRLNAIFAFSLSVTAAVTFACFVTTHFNDYSEDVNISIDRMIV